MTYHSRNTLNIHYLDHKSNKITNKTLKLIIKIILLFFVIFILVIFYLNAYYLDNKNTVSISKNKIISTFHNNNSNTINILGSNIHALSLVSVQNITEDEWNQVKILCWVNTYEKNHERAKEIKRTWGKKCDKLLFMSNIEDLTIPTVRINAPATHDDLWLKHREVLRVIYNEYYGQYKWFFKCDDDTFLLMENIKKYILSNKIQNLGNPFEVPILLGHRMTLQWWEMQKVFEPFNDTDQETLKIMLDIKSKTIKKGGLLYTPGGAGYLLSWAYIKQLTESLDKKYCLPNLLIPDDWAISFCMFYGHNILPFDTRDENKRERFHQYSPKKLYFHPHDDTISNKKVYKSIYQENNWFSDHAGGIDWQNGTNCCAPDSISFHYIKPPLMRPVYDYYYTEN